MAKKSLKNGATEAPSGDVAVDGTGKAGSETITASTDVVHAPVRVNKLNLVELKHACDDATKLYFGRREAFVQSHRNEDVKLVLGWTSSIVALGSAYYGYTNDFQASKLVVTLGVAVYWIVAAIMAYCFFFIERSTIFHGQRKTVSSRISTEKLVVSTQANFAAPSSSALSHLLSYSPLSAFVPPPPFAEPKGPFPSYSIHLSYEHSSNSGKLLIKSGEAAGEYCFGEFFHENGTLGRAELEKVLSELERRSMSGDKE